MEIKQTTYYTNNISFLTKPPESNYTAFTKEGFTYINQKLGIALAMRRTSKSNYDVIVIDESGNLVTVTEHNSDNAVKYVRRVITIARRNKGITQ